MFLTTEGNIVVNGILASCYPSVDHDLSHISMTPLRWFPGIVHWVFGENDGFSTYVKTSEQFGKWMLPDGQIRQF